MSMDKTSLSKNNKYKKAVLWWLLCFIGLFILFVCIYFLAWGMMMQPKPSYQPQLSNKEERFFKALDKRKGWSNTTRFIKNINNKGERILLDTVMLDKDYEYLLTVEIEDSATFNSLPVMIEDTIALMLYNHILCGPSALRKMTIDFSYVEQLAEGLSVGHTLTAIYDVRGKKLVKLKRVKE